MNEVASALDVDKKDNIEDTVNKLVASVKNTMSDHCATNGVFNELLKDLRAEVLPKVVEQWEALNDNEKTTLTPPYFPLVHVRTIRPRHTFFGLAQPSRAATASFWCQRTRNEQGYHLGKWRGHTL